MKKVLAFVLALVLVLGVMSCAQASVSYRFRSFLSPDGISFDKTSYTLFAPKGKKVSLDLKLTVNEQRFNVYSLTFKSSDKGIASIDQNGKVTSQSPGKVTISATVSYINGKTYNAKTTIYVEDGSLTMNKSNVMIQTGKTVSLQANYKHSQQKCYDITWTSSNTSVATVNKSGVVTAKGVGNCTITAKSKVYNSTCTCQITVPTQAISLRHYMTSPLNQNKYSQFVVKGLGNVGCAATAYAIGRSIITKKSVDPVSCWSAQKQCAINTGKHISSWSGKKFDDKAVYTALASGKPVLVHYTWNNGEHWVLVVGVKSGLSVDSIGFSNFIAIDPSSGATKALSSCYHFSSKNNIKYVIMN